MDVTAILKELYRERDLLDQAISTLERAEAGTYRRRGRPPKWLTRVRQETTGQKQTHAKSSNSHQSNKANPNAAGSDR